MLDASGMHYIPMRRCALRGVKNALYYFQIHRDKG